ncbi:putative ABC transport system permease protein [Methylomarinovum tepidoasis]|uniref:ABC transport system permease protein n=1 Tax=Methylomarinovum tepidoasis TaxID=2840183 RepID=A0AAU9CH29_9GAMM|nr:ABC transporter permease [Methylomarinovum sp. IN45]BCX89588.1 putative ABC transport system permease protein [Methylomarinovum sp. IN45]
MRAADRFRFALGALAAYPVRTGLTLLAMAVATAAVVVLTGLGDSARRYVVDQFAGLGTHLLIVLPGRNETRGGPPPLLGEVPRDLTLDDALALQRSRAVARVAPVVVGQAPVAHGGRLRDANIIGTTAEFAVVRNLKLAAGRFLPAEDPHRGRPVAVLGRTLKRALFGSTPALGRWIRIGDRRFRVIGLLESTGHAFGQELDEIAIVPVASAQKLFNTAGLFRVVVQSRSRKAIATAKRDIEAILAARHEGERDVTVLTQDALLAAFDRILRSLTLAVAGIAAISLAVAGILIMNVMLVAVSQRTPEIGLLRALGASTAEVTRLFLTEALGLALLGALLGLLLAFLGLALLNHLWPGIGFRPAPWSLPVAAGVALVTGSVFGLLPARRAARLDPVAALQPR